MPLFSNKEQRQKVTATQMLAQWALHVSTSRLMHNDGLFWVGIYSHENDEIFNKTLINGGSFLTFMECKSHGDRNYSFKGVSMV